jgi:L-threonylcarbamoyladenylate synthase
LIGPRDVAAFEDCVAGGGVVVFPTDTLYGIGCGRGDDAALARVYELKGRRPDKPAAVMWFALERALADLEAAVGEWTRALLERLLPGPVLVVLPDGTGIRVPKLEGPLAPLTAARTPVIQTSANLSGEPPPSRLADVPAALLEGADLVLDAGELPGTASTVVDLSGYEATGSWAVLREGPVSRGSVAEAIAASSAGR